MNEERNTERIVRTIEMESLEDTAGVFGVFDENIPIFEEETGVRIRVRSEGISIEGEEQQVELCDTVLQKLLERMTPVEPIRTCSPRIRWAGKVPVPTRATPPKP